MFGFFLLFNLVSVLCFRRCLHLENISVLRCINGGLYRLFHTGDALLLVMQVFAPKKRRRMKTKSNKSNKPEAESRMRHTVNRTKCFPKLSHLQIRIHVCVRNIYIIIYMCVYVYIYICMSYTEVRTQKLRCDGILIIILEPLTT